MTDEYHVYPTLDDARKDQSWATCLDLVGTIVQFFFDERSVEYWGSKVVGQPIVNPDGRTFFVTEEDNYDQTGKLYTIRSVAPNGFSIETHGNFGDYHTPRDAVQAMRSVADRLSRSDSEQKAGQA